MPKSTVSFWLKLLSSGVVVALLTFVADKGWEAYRHRPVGPKFVETSARFENGRLLVFVRNNSDEPLDLIGARIDIDAPDLVTSETMGAYPDVSKVYEVKPTAGTATIAQSANGLQLNLKITQAIDPGKADQFGVPRACRKRGRG